ncbi:hypothetical protein GCM10025331_00190 [Actinoplanes utahensis]|nr:hypothetical protein Aut01nite_07460 [Actinoplanes utahensis]
MFRFATPLARILMHDDHRAEQSLEQRQVFRLSRPRDLAVPDTQAAHSRRKAGTERGATQ